MRVYRWQDKESGFGPLCGETDFLWELHFKEHNFPDCDDSFNSFTRFFSEEKMKEYFFAWESLEKFEGVLRDGAKEALDGAGFEFTVWELEDDFVVLKDGQVLFNRAKAVRIV